MAPEVIRLRQTAQQNARQRAAKIPAYNHKVDIWSLGVLTFELLFGRQLFAGNDLDTLTAKICHATLAFPDRGVVSDNALFFLRVRSCRFAPSARRPRARLPCARAWARATASAAFCAAPFLPAPHATAARACPRPAAADVAAARPGAQARRG